jgi:hypothetical protein
MGQILDTGYEMMTTCYSDFSIAERFGIKAVKGTYEELFREWKDNYKFLTELVIVLNHKIWEHYYKGNDELAKVYNDLWGKADIYACDNLKGEELSYFYRTTD